MEWTNDMSIQLVREYAARPELWDTSHELYRVQSKKYETWRDLASMFSCDIADIRKKLNSLFASHRREKARVRKGYKSNWFLYHHLSFLPTHVDDSANSETHQRVWPSHKKEPRSSPEPEYQEEEEDEMDEDDEPSPEIEALDEDLETIREHILIKEEAEPVRYKPPKPHRRRPIMRPVRKQPIKPIKPMKPIKTVSSTSTSQLSSRLTEALKLLKSSETFRQKDECDSFGEYIADSLRKHDDRTQSMIKQAINNILFEQEMKKYNTAHYTVVLANSDENPLILDGNDK